MCIRDRIYKFISQLPERAMIAGWPDDPMSNVPYVGHRRALMTGEMHLAYHKGYLDEVRRRITDFFEAYYASSTGPIFALRDKYGVTHMFLELKHFQGPAPGYMPPLGARAKAFADANRSRGFELMRQLDRATVAKSGDAPTTGGSTAPSKEPAREATARDARPADLSAGAFSPQQPEAFTLSNGVNVQFWQRDELPLVELRMVCKPRGLINEPRTAGLAYLTSAMMGEGTKSLDSLAFSDAMATLGASFDAYADNESVGIALSVLKRNFDKALALARDAVATPRMEESDWERVKRLHIEELKQDDDEPATVAARVGLRTLFGDESSYAWPLPGTPETVSGLTLENVKAAHASLFSPAGATLLVAGNMTKQELKSSLDRTLGGWTSAGAAAASSAPEPRIPPSSALRVVVVDRPEAVQTVIRFVMPGVRFADENRARLRLLNTLLGGSFTSRLNQNLREKNGFTYGARSGFAMRPAVGYFTAGASVKASATGPALKEFLSEFARLRAGDVSDDEVTKARETIRTDTIQSFQGLGGVLTSAAELVVNGLPFTTVEQDLKLIPSVGARDLNALANRSIPLENGVLVLVGDKTLILDQIKDLGLPTPIETDVRGTPLSTPK